MNRTRLLQKAMGVFTDPRDERGVRRVFCQGGRRGL